MIATCLSLPVHGALRFAVYAVAVWCVAVSPVLAQEIPSRQESPSATDAYRLDVGDTLKLTVYGEDDLSGEFVVEGGGDVRLPLVGAAHAAGLTVPEFEEAVEARLRDGYLVNPRIRVELFSPFIILGEVNKPGQYPFAYGMSALAAVALAGGFSPRADDDEVYIRRNGSHDEAEYPADQATKIYPGDVVRVAERFF